MQFPRSRFRCTSFFAAFSLAFILTIQTHAQRGAITAPRTLPQLTESAATIVQGFVLSAKVEPHPELRGIQTVVVTLHVARTLKGTPTATFTFRQFIWDIRDRYDAAGYRRGQNLLLFMRAPSQYGLSSPVGLDQGRFRITRDARGNFIATNGAANAGLLRGVTEKIAVANLSRATAATLAQHHSGAIPLPQLTEMITKLEQAK